MTDAIANRVSRALVSILIEGDDDAPLYIGSGVLVRLAGVEFVFTVGHNIWNKILGELNQISVLGGARGMNFFSTPGDGSAQLARVLRRRQDNTRNPTSRSSSCPTRRCCVPTVGRSRKMRSASLRRTRRASEEPEGGRGVHMFIDEKGWDERRQQACELPSPYGMSGGPLVVPTGRGVLVGVARSRVAFQDGHDEWCEPAIEAVRALVEHGAPDVAASATRILDRASHE